MPAVVVRDLVKHYDGTVAVDGISFKIEAGEVYGLLGENGAGKTTTIEILEGHRQRTSGDVNVLGRDPGAADRDFRHRIGIVLQSSGVERQLTVAEVLALYGSCYRRPRPVDECIALVGLDGAAGKRVETLSGGQRRRLDLALGILGNPELLFLDEPTTGFDPAARRSAWELIRSLCSSGTTVLLTSHYLDEVEQLADRVGVLASGRLVAEGPPRTLVASPGTTTIRFQFAGDLTALPRLSAVASVRGDVVELVTSSPTADLHRLTGWAIERGHDLTGLIVARPSLEDLFLELAANDRDQP